LNRQKIENAEKHAFISKRWTRGARSVSILLFSFCFGKSYALSYSGLLGVK
jgi:hypothetical protein